MSATRTAGAAGNKVAVSVGASTLEEFLELTRPASAFAAWAEVRLDLAAQIDVERWVRCSPLPLVVTCRPVREGGAFDGSERERLQILVAATRAGAAFVDVEWDARAQLVPARGSRTRIMVSRHFANMPPSLLAEYERLRVNADAVKLVGTASRPHDLLPVLELLAHATSPVVAVAMGAAGQASRLLAPTFAATLLTYGAAHADRVTAPGQLTVEAMCRRHRLDRVGPGTRVHVYVNAEAPPPPNDRGDELHVELPVARDEADSLALALTGYGFVVHDQAAPRRAAGRT